MVEKIGFAEGHTFILDLVASKPVCIDLGANQGNFASFIESHTPASVVSVEPVSELFEALPTGPRRSKIRAIVRSEPGETTINIYENCCPTVMDVPGGGVRRSETVVCRTLEDIFDMIEAPEIGLVKIDIEGTEMDVLKGTPRDVLRRAAQYTVEFHDFMDASLRPSVEEAIHHMEKSGFVKIRFSRDNSNILFVRDDRFRYGALSRVWLAGPVKYLSGIVRIAARVLRPNPPTTA